MIQNLQDLRYFLEVAGTGNITRAAERLGLSQPSITLALKRLEADLHVELLERSRKGVLLTRAGEQLKARGEVLLSEWEREMRSVSQIGQGPTGRYRIGVHVSVAQYALGELTAKLMTQFDQLELSFKHDLSRHVTEEVISRQCDIGLVINPVRHPDLVLRRLLTDEVTLFARAQHVSDVLIYDPELKQSQFLLRQVAKKITFRRQIISSSLEFIRTMAQAGAGVAILPTRVAAMADELKMLKGAPSFKDELFIIYRVERKREAGLRLILDAIETRQS